MTLATTTEHASTQQMGSVALAEKDLEATFVNLTYASGRNRVPIMGAVSSNLTTSLSVCVGHVDVSLHRLSLQLVTSVSTNMINMLLFDVSIYIETKTKCSVVLCQPTEPNYACNSILRCHMFLCQSINAKDGFNVLVATGLCSVIVIQHGI